MNKTLDQIDKFLKDKDNQKYHFNNYDEEEYKISSGSLNLDLALGGGLPAGAHRFTGVNEGGKTSCALAVGKNFQEYFGKNGMVIIIKSEGRLSSAMLKRSGINTDPEQLFIFDCNVFEKVFELIRDLVFNNEDKKRYMFIVDSVDALCRMNDIDKPFSESEQVAGGALVTSVFLKKMVLPITKMGHMMILTSQVRIEIPSSAYAARGGPKVKQAGGNAIKHYANFILEFEERYNNDIMWENPSATKLDDKGDPIGHYCKARFRKSINEKTGAQVRYPIRYGRTDGNSIWLEKEIIDMLYLWGYIEKKGAWISFDEDILLELKKRKIECPEKIQGDQKMLELLETNVKLKDYFYNTINKLFEDETK
jgi:recombination protein RecA